MEQTHRDLANTILKKAAESKYKRYLVVLAGVPGAGKSTVADEVVKIINSRQGHLIEEKGKATAPNYHRLHSPRAQAIGMDGFHLPREVLDRLPNRDEAYRRRGAPWTFDAEGARDFALQLRRWIENTEDSSSTLTAPTFDHAVKDPVPHGIKIEAPIIILEGIYALLDQPIWREIAPLADFRIFIDVDEDAARTRVARRHVTAGIESNLEDAFARVDANDTLNGRLIREQIVGADIRLKSVDL